MTTQTTAASIDLDARTVTRTVRVPARPHAVWRALTEPEHVAGWFGDACETTDGAPFAVGGRGRLHFEGYGWFPFEVTRLDPGELLAFRWGQSVDDPDHYTEATFTLVADGDATVLTVLETGFTGADDDAVRAALEGNREGWDGELDELVAYVGSREW
ncbi:SRPBCC domain-containing protein [Antribacter gilvus]|uniref:SRPBCC domain-containing protein n=1 Tax=Antribacter gilvus TaxID=2304675 RepID=UPI000F78ACDA|nr:SRPBCC domain-containing protein [Antribacter gilvus]